MRILVVSNLFPWPLDRAITQRIHHLTAYLAERHAVTFVSLAREDEDTSGSPLHDSCERVVLVREWQEKSGTRLWDPIRVQLRSLIASPFPSSVSRFRWPLLTRVLAQIHAEAEFDLVWVQRAPLAECARRAGLNRIVVDLADLDAVSVARAIDNTGWYGTKPLHWLELWKLRLYERALPRRFQGVTVCKEDDRAFFGRNSSRVLVVPNGIVPAPSTAPELEQLGELLFVGTLEYEPNVDACDYFVRCVLPLVREQLPSARLTIVGRSAGPGVRALHDGDRCTVIDSAPDLAPYYERASVVVVPIRLGSGTRLKILEALSRGKAVVSTTVGAEGLGLQSGRHLEIADTPRAFADACGRLSRDPEGRRRLAASGRQLVISRFTWDSICSDAEERLRAFLPASRVVPRGSARTGVSHG
jgi:glycosyltransferase involved in cell wall biosynthesis